MRTTSKVGLALAAIAVLDNVDDQLLLTGDEDYAVEISIPMKDARRIVDAFATVSGHRGKVGLAMGLPKTSSKDLRRCFAILRPIVESARKVVESFDREVRR